MGYTQAELGEERSISEDILVDYNRSYCSSLFHYQELSLTNTLQLSSSPYEYLFFVIFLGLTLSDPRRYLSPCDEPATCALLDAY